MTCHTTHVWVVFTTIVLVGCSGAKRAVGPKTTIEAAGATSETSSQRVASDPRAARFARARRHVLKSPKCQDVLKKYPSSKKVFEKHIPQCPKCGGAAAESIGRGARLHGVDPEMLVAELNSAARPRKKK